MKKIFLVVGLPLIMGSQSLSAQTDFSRSLNGVEWVKIETKSQITLKTHDKEELLIKVSQKMAKPERAKGLKLVGAGGTDNTDIGFSVVESGSSIIVSDIRRSKGAEIFLPKSQNVSVTNSWDGDIHIAGFKGEVEANANLNGGLSLENVSGPVTAYSLNRGIKVVFDKINQDAPIIITTTNGEIDVTLPENTSADVELKSLNGDIYTNFDLGSPDKNGLKSISRRTVEGQLNNGGVRIRLESTNGNIYLRKK